MSVVSTFREIFQHKLERELTRLQRKAGEGGAPVEEEQLNEMRRLTNDMTESFLRRLGNHAAQSGLDLEEGAGAAAAVPDEEMLPGARQDDVASCDSSRRAQKQKLQARLEEETKLRAELFERFKAKCGSRLEKRERQLLEVRQAATADAEGAGARSVVAADVYSGFADHVASIQDRLRATKESIADLERKTRRVERLEEQQARPWPAVEAVLFAAGNPEGDYFDEEDRRLAEVIERGNQVCKRMRRLYPHSAAGA
mmetsp:Transcript_5331/g.10588  ORF Transcript_5331/g.10588 Transcript_5331/m.10588 type:complete len:256 (+) Transcript_5331:74-841(+)